MDTITLSEDRFRKVLTDVEMLVEDVTALINQDDVVRKRIAEIRANPFLGKSEGELDEYLKKRGVKIDLMSLTLKNGVHSINRAG